MKIEDRLEKLRKDYVSIHPKHEFSQSGWQDLYARLDTKPKLVFFFMPSFARGVVFAALFILILTASTVGLVQASRQSLPGEPLYPVKRISENVSLLIYKDPKSRVENRAQEIINLAQEEKDGNRLQKITQEYKKTVLETKEEIQKSGKSKEEFEKILEKQEKQFEEAIKNGSSYQNQLEEAIETSRQGRDSREEEKEDDKNKQEENKQEEDRSGSNSGKN